MTDERVEPTKEWLKAWLMDEICERLPIADTFDAMNLADAILASQPERVECPHRTLYQHWRQINGWNYCPFCGQSLKGAGEK